MIKSVNFLVLFIGISIKGLNFYSLLAKPPNQRLLFYDSLQKDSILADKGILSMKKEALAKLFYREIEKIISNPALDEMGRIESLYRLFNLLFIELTRPERLHFTTLFARIAYTCHKYHFERQLHRE